MTPAARMLWACLEAGELGDSYASGVRKEAVSVIGFARGREATLGGLVAAARLGVTPDEYRALAAAVERLEPA